MKQLGQHIILELFNCRKKELDDLRGVEKAMLKAAEAAKVHPVGKLFHKFAPQGVSGVVVIKESHLSIHTWPECHYAAVDIFTCGKNLQPEEAIKFLKRYFNSKKISVLEIGRGAFLRIKNHN